MMVLLGVSLGSIVMFLLMVLLNDDCVGDKAFPESEEKVVKLTTFVLNLIVGLLLLLMDMGTVLLMLLSGILCVVRGGVPGSILGVVMSDVLLVILSGVLCLINGTVLLVKLSAVNLVVLSHILRVVLSVIIFNGNCLCMIHFFGYVFL